MTVMNGSNRCDHRFERVSPKWEKCAKCSKYRVHWDHLQKERDVTRLEEKREMDSHHHEHDE